MQYTKHGENKPLNKLIGRRRHYDKTRLSLNRVVVCGDQQTEQKDEELKERGKESETTTSLFANSCNPDNQQETERSETLGYQPTGALLIFSERNLHCFPPRNQFCINYNSDCAKLSHVFHSSSSFLFSSTLENVLIEEEKTFLNGH